jgi:hypothetical protein
MSRRVGPGSGAGEVGRAAVRSPLPLSRVGAVGAGPDRGPTASAEVAAGERIPISAACVSATVGLAAGAARSLWRINN